MRANRCTQTACILQDKTHRAQFCLAWLRDPRQLCEQLFSCLTHEIANMVSTCISTCRVRTEVATRGEPLWSSGLLRTSGVLAQPSSPPVRPKLKETGLQVLLTAYHHSAVSGTTDPTDPNRLSRHLDECIPLKRGRYVSARHSSQSGGIRIVPCRQRCTCTAYAEMQCALKSQAGACSRVGQHG